MKNLKNMLSAAGLMAVMVFGAVSANAGLMISDRTANTGQCTANDSSFLHQLSGILIVGFNGIIIIDRAAPQCTETDGLMISDKDGIIIIDKQ